MVLTRSFDWFGDCHFRPVTRDFVEAKGLEPSNLLTASRL
jgi:hypothetical protein